MTRTGERAALVTGGSSGIGRSVAAALLTDGWSVTVCGRSAERLDDAVTTLEAYGDVHRVVADTTVVDDIASLVDSHEQRFGRLDALVSCAGAVDLGGIGDGSVEAFDAMVDANVRSTWRLIGAATPMLSAAGAEHGTALVVAIGSILGRYAQSVTAAYSVSKAAVFAMMQAAHDELSGRGIRATTIAPAFVATPMTEPLAHLDRSAMIDPDDVAETVRYLTRLGPTSAVPEVLMLQTHDRLLAI
jgi:NAD(P)-dependent dehydrogenase (short-subunit alcohol dehydrogenase family)